jgi:hypothetical protein
MNSNYRMDTQLANRRIGAHRRQAELVRLAHEGKTRSEMSGFQRVLHSLRQLTRPVSWLGQAATSSEESAGDSNAVVPARR